MRVALVFFFFFLVCSRRSSTGSASKHQAPMQIEAKQKVIREKETVGNQFQMPVSR
jgi:hypothetical protein